MSRGPEVTAGLGADGTVRTPEWLEWRGELEGA